MIMVAKHVYDVRGRQSSIFRLYCSDKGALLHMLSYRISIIFAIITILYMLYALYAHGTILNHVSETFIVVIAITMTPQLFESLKAFFVILSKGVVFGHLNSSFIKFGVKQHLIYKLYRLLPYILIVIWVVGVLYLAAAWSL